ncbi:MAG: BON domain-containing protein [Thiogranum sp.]|nr:BON domain-containing protein [Thiogranum sp.]
MISQLTFKLVCLSLVFSLTACATAVVGGAARGGYNTDAASGSDASITSAISASYVRDDLVSAFDVNVSTWRGDVTLSGSVPSQRAAQRAVELAKSVRGVKRVVSNLTIRER